MALGMTALTTFLELNELISSSVSQYSDLHIAVGHLFFLGWTLDTRICKHLDLNVFTGYDATINGILEQWTFDCITFA